MSSLESLSIYSPGYQERLLGRQPKFYVPLENPPIDIFLVENYEDIPDFHTTMVKIINELNSCSIGQELFFRLGKGLKERKINCISVAIVVGAKSKLSNAFARCIETDLSILFSEASWNRKNFTPINNGLEPEQRIITFAHECIHILHFLELGSIQYKARQIKFDESDRNHLSTNLEELLTIRDVNDLSENHFRHLKGLPLREDHGYKPKKLDELINYENKQVHFFHYLVKIGAGYLVSDFIARFESLQLCKWHLRDSDGTLLSTAVIKSCLQTENDPSKILDKIYNNHLGETLDQLFNDWDTIIDTTWPNYQFFINTLISVAEKVNTLESTLFSKKDHQGHNFFMKTLKLIEHTHFKSGDEWFIKQLFSEHQEKIDPEWTYKDSRTVAELAATIHFNLGHNPNKKIKLAKETPSLE